MEDEKNKLQLVIDNTELKGVIEATKIFAQTLSNYSFQKKIYSISNTLAEITKNINSSYIFDMCSTVVKNYHNQIKTLTDSLTNIKLDRMIAIQKIMQQTIEYIKENCELNSCVEYKSNLFKELSQATGYIVRDERENAVELVENALPAKISKKGIEMVNLFEKVQKLDLSLVILTPNTCGAIARIVSLIASNDDEFELICNSLYQLFYEGFGSNNHRASKYVPFDDCDALITIKHLRLSYDHDIYHGNKNEIEKKNQKIMNAFYKLIKKRMPESPKDYKLCQLRLYEIIIDWLKAIIDKINNQPVLIEAI